MNLGRERFYPPKDIDELQARLVRSVGQGASKKSFPIFATKARLMVFAAAVGATLNLKGRKVVDSRGEGIRETVLNDDLYFVITLGVAHEKSLDVLRRDDDHILTVFEELAHAGLRHIDSLLRSQNGKPLDVIVGLIRKLTKTRADEVDEVFDLANM